MPKMLNDVPLLQPADAEEGLMASETIFMVFEQRYEPILACLDAFSRQVMGGFTSIVHCFFIKCKAVHFAGLHAALSCAIASYHFISRFPGFSVRKRGTTCAQRSSEAPEITAFKALLSCTTKSNARACHDLRRFCQRFGAGTMIFLI